MKRLFDTEGLKDWVQMVKSEGDSLGFVPTMGYLHEGHLALVRQARQQNRRVIVSIYVNPLQFGPKEDLASYPRDIERDSALLEAEGVDALFMPTQEGLFAQTPATIVEVKGLSDRLIGALRPGHFCGVTTIVSKLFALVQPDRAYFGKKDYQQLVIIRRMVEDLSLPVMVIGVDTVREADGLACSSRNVHLSEEQRLIAPLIYRTMKGAAALFDAGETKADVLVGFIRDTFDRTLKDRPDASLQSVDICSVNNLLKIDRLHESPVVILLAFRLGSVLLIDQLEL